jgi:hypothetical protein
MRTGRRSLIGRSDRGSFPGRWIIGNHRLRGAAAFLFLSAAPLGAVPVEDGAVKSFSLGPLTLHVASRPFRFSVLQDGRPLLAERARRDAGSLELLVDGVWRPAAGVLAVRARGEGSGLPAATVVVESSVEGAGSADVRFAWSDERGVLEISYAAAKGAPAGLRDDFVTQPEEPLLLFGEAAGRRLVLSPRFALLAGAAAPGEEPAVFAPDPDAVRIQTAASSLLLRIVPGAPRAALDRLASLHAVKPAAEGSVASPSLPLLWIDVGSRPTSGDEARLRDLIARAPIVEGAGAIFAEGGAPAFRVLAGEAPSRLPGRIVVDGWKPLRSAAAAAIEAAVLAAEPRVVQIPGDAGEGDGAPPGELWARAIAMAMLQPAVALRRGLIADAAAAAPAVAGPRGERARIVRRLLRARAALAPVLSPAAAAPGRPTRGLAPLFVEHPEEEGAWKARDEWLLARDILVAPVLEEGARGRAVYFPSGTWRDLRAGSPDGAARPLRGPGLHRIEIPPGDVGLFAREGGDADLARALAEALGSGR